jgi:hypothetical protein
MLFSVIPAVPRITDFRGKLLAGIPWPRFSPAFAQSRPRIRSRAGAGVQNTLKQLDSGLRRNDRKTEIPTFYEAILFGNEIDKVISFSLPLEKGAGGF